MLPWGAWVVRSSRKRADRNRPGITRFQSARWAEGLAWLRLRRQQLLPPSKSAAWGGKNILREVLHPIASVVVSVYYGFAGTVLP